MSTQVHLYGNVAFLESSGAAVFMSDSSKSKYGSGTAVPVQKLQNLLKIAFWGEDNRFPQNIEQQLAYCGVARAGLDFKARALYGSGIIPCKVTGYADSDGKVETIQALDRNQYKEVYDFIENRSMFRFFMEYLQDWVTYSNCFPEVILSNDGKKITKFVHQESCDFRFEQMNDEGDMPIGYLSKMWGKAANQFARFDPDKKIQGLIENPDNINSIDPKFIKKMNVIDIYDDLESLRKIAKELNATVDLGKLKSAILPVNYPSVNKTYYQVPVWDGARLAGWLEIASKVPAIIKSLFKKGMRIKYHIEIPETFFESKYGTEEWNSYDKPKQTEIKKELLEQMNEYLTGEKNAFQTFASFFGVERVNKNEYGRIKITPIEDKSPLDKEFITGSAANVEILTAMGLDPTLIGSGTIGTGQQRTAGSDKREAYLIYTSLLNLERQVVLQPLYLARDFNGWDSDIQFRIRDVQLTTLDKNSGTQKVVS